MTNNCEIGDLAGNPAAMALGCHGVRRLGRLTIDAAAPNAPIQAKPQPCHL